MSEMVAVFSKKSSLISIEMKYNLLFFVYTIANCCLTGFVAIFLRYKEISNTSIGIVTGIGSVSTLFLAPILSSFIGKNKLFTVQKLFTMIYGMIMLLFLLIVYSSIPAIAVLGIYTLLIACMNSTTQFLQILATDLAKSGEKVNFGLARGLGSSAWAISSLIFGFLIDVFDPTILGISYLIFNSFTLILINQFPTTHGSVSSESKKQGMWNIVKKYRIYLINLVGFTLFLSSASALGTYLINIVENLGGTTSFYGVAVFMSSLSELPFMAITPRLLKKYSSKQLMLFAGICYLARNVLIGMAPNLFVMCVGMLFQGASYGLFIAVLTYYVMDHFAEDDQVMGQTFINVMTVGVGCMLGNILGGYLQDMFGLNAMFIFTTIITIIGMVVCVYGNQFLKGE